MKTKEVCPSCRGRVIAFGPDVDENCWKACVECDKYTKLAPEYKAPLNHNRQTHSYVRL